MIPLSLQMGPEQLSGGGYGPETDLWACGVCLFSSLAGNLPFRVRNMRGGASGVGTGLESWLCPTA